MISDTIDIKAKLTLYPTESCFWIQRKLIRFCYDIYRQIEFEKELILPSETENVKVRFLKHQNIVDLIEKGRNWWIHEGPNKIGEAEITEILDEKN